MLLALALLGGVVPVAQAATSTSALPGAIDPNLRVHPYLQRAARLEPTRKARVLVQKASASASTTAIATAAGKDSLKEEFPFIQSLVLEILQQQVFALAQRSDVAYITPDGLLKHKALNVEPSQLRTTYPQSIEAPGVWNGTAPATGRGVTVAVLDTGVNLNHADLLGDVSCVVVNPMAKSCDDQYGHGTHVIGIITGRNAQGRYIGVAPNARVIGVKFATDQGGARESDMIRGLQWVYSNRVSQNIRVVNISAASSLPTSYVVSPIDAAVDRVWQSGVTVVTSSGNEGTAVDATRKAPANNPSAVTVGALDTNETAATSDDQLAFYSSRGLTQDGVYKPEIVAPGRKIVSTLAGNKSALAQTFPDRITDRSYLRLSGTSMAAPVVAGTVALLLERYPSLTPNQIKWLLTNSASAYPGQADAAGMVHAAKLLQRAAQGTLGQANQSITLRHVTTQTTSGFLGSVQWGQAYWNQAYWNQTTWDQAYWNQTYWDQAYWNQVYWNQTTWDGAFFD